VGRIATTVARRLASALNRHSRSPWAVQSLEGGHPLAEYRHGLHVSPCRAIIEGPLRIRPRSCAPRGRGARPQARSAPALWRAMMRQRVSSVRLKNRHSVSQRGDGLRSRSRNGRARRLWVTPSACRQGLDHGTYLALGRRRRPQLSDDGEAQVRTPAFRDQHHDRGVARSTSRPTKRSHGDVAAFGSLRAPIMLWSKPTKRGRGLLESERSGQRRCTACTQRSMW
jgi:hypothetical protein